MHPIVKLLEKVLKVRSLLVADLKSDLLGDLGKLLYGPKVLLQVGLDLSIRPCVSLDHGQLVAGTIAILEEERASKAFNAALAHDCDSISKYIGLIHVVRRQQNNSIVSVVLEHVPEGAPRTQIHSGSGFIEQD